MSWDFRATKLGCIYIESLQNSQKTPKPCTCNLKALPSEVWFGSWVRMESSWVSASWWCSSFFPSWGCPGAGLVLKLKIKLYSRDVRGDSLGALNSLLSTMTSLGRGWDGLCYEWLCSKQRVVFTNSPLLGAPNCHHPLASPPLSQHAWSPC